jgi:hypothetical protein
LRQLLNARCVFCGNTFIWKSVSCSFHSQNVKSSEIIYFTLLINVFISFHIIFRINFRINSLINFLINFLITLKKCETFFAWNRSAICAKIGRYKLDAHTLYHIIFHRISKWCWHAAKFWRKLAKNHIIVPYSRNRHFGTSTIFSGNVKSNFSPTGTPIGTKIGTKKTQIYISHAVKFYWNLTRFECVTIFWKTLLIFLRE